MRVSWTSKGRWSEWSRMIAAVGCALVVGVSAACVSDASAQMPADAPSAERQTDEPTAPRDDEPILDRLIRLLPIASIDVVGSDAQTRPLRTRSGTTVEVVQEAELIAALQARPLTDAQATRLWGALADADVTAALSPPLLKAFVSATATLETRDAMWSALAGIASSWKGSKVERDRTLLGLFERRRSDILPLLTAPIESEGSGNIMLDLAGTSRVFGDDVDDSVVWLGFNRPAAAARRIERERAQGRAVKWEFLAFDQMRRWRDRHLVPRAPEPPKTLAALDEMGSTFITIVNALHDFDEWFRRKMIEPLKPAGVFDAVVGGEAELYRLGTSSYQSFLHPTIMRGIAESGSFEAFLKTTGPARLGMAESGETWRRGMVFLRIATAFARLEPVLATVRDQERFVDDAVASLADPVQFESNGSVLLDILTGQILTGRSDTAATTAFRKRLLDRLYTRHASEPDDTRRKTYGSLLSVYQTVTGDRREPGVDKDYPLDTALLQLSYDRAFSPAPGGGVVHRVFMRFDSDTDAVSSFGGFQAVMSARRAEVRARAHHVVYRVTRGKRTIEVYANRPTADGVKAGIAELTTALRGLRVHTVVGRGHTGILGPLRRDSAQVLNSRLKDVAVVIVGTCGGSASVRDLITTFGYTPIVSTRSTGRQVINNAIIDRYLMDLLAMPADQSLALADVVSAATAPLMRPSEEEELREHAAFYDINAASVFAAVLFDRYVRKLDAPVSRAVTDKPPRVAATAREPELPRPSKVASQAKPRSGAEPSGGGGATTGPPPFSAADR